MPRLSRTILEQIVNLSGEALLVADAHRAGLPVVLVNRTFERVVRIEPGAAEGREWSFFLDRDHCAAQVDAAAQRASGGSACEITLTGQHGARLQITLTPLQGRHGRVRYLLARVEVVAETRSVADEVKVGLKETELDRGREASTDPDRRDPETGLLRYDYFLELCQRDFALCSRQRRELAMLVFTVREFDVYRRTFGDKAAQSCLRMVGGRITGALRRAGDLSARMDEASFAALITAHNQEQAAKFAAHIAHQVRRLALHHPRASGERYVTCAVGLRVGVPQHDDRPEQFVLAARESQDALAAGKPAA